MTLNKKNEKLLSEQYNYREIKMTNNSDKKTQEEQLKKILR
jgi:hypothetical protein